MRRIGLALAFGLALVVGCGDADGATDGALADGGALPDGAPVDAGNRDGEAPRPDAGGPASPPAGLFIDRASLERARARGPGSDSGFEAGYSLVLSRARAARDEPSAPFTMDDVTEIRFGWCGADRGQPGTLSKATGDFERGSDRIRSLALAYALSEDAAWAEEAVSQMRAWADAQTLVNLYDLGANLRAGSLDAQTDGFCSDRPWNFALDAMWQAYGVINAADAYLLLTLNGHSLSAEDDAAIRDWIRRAAEAVNASFRAWTEWADAHPSSGSFERYRSDNHLSWALAGLVAAAAALGDDALASYVLEGGSYTDSRGGAYANPSHVRDVIDRAIEGGEERGRFFEESIGRDPPIGYSFFHLWALELIAQVADVHYGEDLWSFTGADGAGLHDAYHRYAAFVLGERPSPEPEQDGDMTGHRWHYELAYRRWDDPRFNAPLAVGAREQFIVQSIGPVALLLGRD